MSKLLIDYIEKFEEVHGKDKYLYNTNTRIDNDYTEIEVECRTHNFKFKTNLMEHLIGRECPICFREKTKEKQRQNTKKYFGVEKLSNPMPIFCVKHGNQEIPLNSFKNCNKHLRNPCPSCREEMTIHDQKVSMFLKKAGWFYNHRYSYDMETFTDEVTEMVVICKEHDEFHVTPKNHLHGVGCPKCRDGNNEPEYEIKEFIKSIYDGQIISAHKVKQQNNYEIDILLPDLNLGIEFNGLYYHSARFKSPEYHLHKKQDLMKEGIKLVFIYANDWNENRFAIKNYLRSLISPISLDYVNCTFETITKSEMIDFSVFSLRDNIFGDTYFCIKEKDKVVGIINCTLNNKFNELIIHDLIKIGPYRNKDLLNILLHNIDDMYTDKLTLISAIDNKFPHEYTYKRVGFTVKQILPPKPFYFQEGQKVLTLPFNEIDPSNTVYNVGYTIMEKVLIKNNS